MQTFLPYPSFQQSAECLDNRRLGKQRVECLQILKTLRDGGAWHNHPAVLMWKGHNATLALYADCIIDQWLHRGFKDTCREKIRAIADSFLIKSPEQPIWLGDPSFHASHRSNLLRKDPVWYGRFGWTESPDLPYVWPVTKQHLTTI